MLPNGADVMTTPALYPKSMLASKSRGTPRLKANESGMRPPNSPLETTSSMLATAHWGNRSNARRCDNLQVATIIYAAGKELRFITGSKLDIHASPLGVLALGSRRKKRRTAS